MYISFFHGRDNIHQNMEGWGEEGPIVGPVTLSWTYGNLKIHDGWNEEFEFLPYEHDLIKIDNMYYGDFELWDDSDELLTKEDNKERIINYKEFIKLISL